MNSGSPSDLGALAEPGLAPTAEVEATGRNKVIQSLFSAAAYQGPIPPAQEAENWNRVVDGAAERILHMAELEASHRHALEREQLEQALQLQLSDLEDRRRELELNHQLHTRVLLLQAHRDDQRNERIRMGQVFGLLLGSGALIVAAYLGVLGQPWVAAIMGTGGLAGIVWAAISGGRRNNEQEKSQGPAPPPKEENGDRCGSAGNL